MLEIRVQGPKVEVKTLGDAQTVAIDTALALQTIYHAFQEQASNAEAHGYRDSLLAILSDPGVQPFKDEELYDERKKKDGRQGGI